MSDQVNVRSVDAIGDFRAALIVFNERVNDAITALQEQVFYALDWVENDRPRYWRQEVLDALDSVAESRNAMETNRMRKEGFGFRPSLIEEKKALALAKQRLAYCQEKVEIVKQTGIDFRQETDEFVGRLGQLQRLVETDIPKMVGLLERMILALEKYSEFTGKLEASDNSE